MAEPLSTVIFISQDKAFGFGGTAMAMVDEGNCRCLLQAQRHFAVLQHAFRSLAARAWVFFGWRFGNSVEDRIAKILMRDGESAMVWNFDCY